MSGSHRGFAFIEFVSHNEAKNAFEALGSTHLYGRRLVLEWSNIDSENDLNTDVTNSQSTDNSQKQRTHPAAMMETLRREKTYSQNKKNGNFKTEANQQVGWV